MKKAKMVVWVLAPGKPNVDRKALCKAFDIKTGIYTSESADTPAWLKEALITLAGAAEWLEGDLPNNKSYSLVALPAAVEKSPAMKPALLKYAKRIKSTYWLMPSNIAAVQGMLDAINNIDEAIDHLVTTEEIAEDEIDYLCDAAPAKTHKKSIKRDVESIINTFEKLGEVITRNMLKAVSTGK